MVRSFSAQVTAQYFHIIHHSYVANFQIIDYARDENE